MAIGYICFYSSKISGMQVFRLALVILVILVIVNPTDAWNRWIKRKVKRIGKTIKKTLCKHEIGVGCKVEIGTGAKTNCHIKRQKCKRSVVSDEILLPFSDDFRDYDYNEDDLISYEEFVFAVMVSLPMANPRELKKPFMYADTDDNDYLDFDEFEAAPFLFADIGKYNQRTNGRRAIFNLEVNGTMNGTNQTETRQVVDRF